MLADKATAQAEIARNLRSGAATPASLPPDLAVVLSGEEQAELEDWWRDGLRVAPDAALFESLHALFPAFPEEVSLEASRIARHLSQEQQALVRRRRGETGTPDAPGAAMGEGAGAGDRLRLAGLDETLAEAGFDTWTAGPDGPWGVKRRRVSTLPDDPDPRETQLAVGIFGDDGGEGGGRDGGEGETSPQQSAQDAETEADETDVEDTTQGEQETTVLDGIRLLPNAAAEELSRIQKELAERTDLSEEEIEAYGRDILKLTPGLGEVLSAQDAVDALRAAREALVNKDFQAALSSTAEGLVELGGAIPFLGKLVRGGKIGLRVARDLAKRLGRTSLGRGLRQKANRDDRRPEGQLPAGSVARINTPNGVKADVDTFEATHRHLERLYAIAEDVGVRHVDAVSGLLNGVRLNIRVESGKEIVNIDHLGGRAAAEAAFREAIGKAGGKLPEVRPWPRGGVAWEAPDGTKYRLYQSKNHGETVLVAVPSPRAPVSIKEWQLKLRYLELKELPSVD